MKRFAIALVLLALAAMIPPSQSMAQTLCNSDAECPKGQLCCYPCGIDGCHNVCMNPIRGECPLFV
jgi:hypothetical protein